MWRKADVVRQLIFDRLELKPGDKVLVIGEGVEGCGFGDDIRQHLSQARAKNGMVISD